MGKTITICFTNNKGGSGKSTTCSNLGAAIAQTGKKVLLVDGDMQLNLSLYQKTEWQKTEYLPSTEVGICHEFLYVPRETFFILFHVVWKWITFITVKTLNRPDELLCGLFLLFASRVLRFGKSIV